MGKKERVEVDIYIVHYIIFIIIYIYQIILVFIWHTVLPCHHESSTFHSFANKKNATNFLSFLRLRSFAARSALEISEALPKLRSLGASEFVIDLRGNGGIRFFPIDFVGFDESIYDTNIYIYI